MSSISETIQTKAALMPASNLSLWSRQIGAILRLELKKNFFGKRSILVYLLAMLPVGLVILVEAINP